MRPVRRFASFGFFAGALLLSGCVPPKATISATRDAAYAQEPKRVMVIETIGDELGHYHDTFKADLSRRMLDCGATIDFTVRPPRDPLALDNSAALAQQRKEDDLIREFGADALLQITQNWVIKSDSIPPLPRMIGYSLRLIDVPTKKAVWTADVRLFTAIDLVTIGDPGAAFARDTMTKLVQDKIFSSCSAANLRS